MSAVICIRLQLTTWTVICNCNEILKYRDSQRKMNGNQNEIRISLT